MHNHIAQPLALVYICRSAATPEATAAAETSVQCAVPAAFFCLFRYFKKQEIILWRKKIGWRHIPRMQFAAACMHACSCSRRCSSSSSSSSSASSSSSSTVSSSSSVSSSNSSWCCCCCLCGIKGREGFIWKGACTELLSMQFAAASLAAVRASRLNN